jgi:UDP-N-acetyl-D-galactosamine dehydrogenase
VIDVIRELQSYGIEVCVHDPVPNADDAYHEYGLKLYGWDELPEADAVVVAVAHKEFLQRPMSDYLRLARPNGVFIDVKSRFDRGELSGAGLNVWRL